MNASAKRLADRVRARRTQLGLSQVELAARAELSEATIRVIETARRDSFEPSTLRAVSTALDWPPRGAQLVWDGGEPFDDADGPLSPSEAVDLVLGREVLDRLDRMERMVGQLLEKALADEADKGTSRSSAADATERDEEADRQ